MDLLPQFLPGIDIFCQGLDGFDDAGLDDAGITCASLIRIVLSSVPGKRQVAEQ